MMDQKDKNTAGNSARERFLRVWESSLDLGKEFENASKEMNRISHGLNVPVQSAEISGDSALQFREMLNARQDDGTC